MGGWAGGPSQRIMPLCGSILQAGTCQILSLAENPRLSRVWQYLIAEKTLLQIFHILLTLIKDFYTAELEAETLSQQNLPWTVPHQTLVDMGRFKNIKEEIFIFRRVGSSRNRSFFFLFFFLIGKSFKWQ